MTYENWTKFSIKEKKLFTKKVKNDLILIYNTSNERYLYQDYFFFINLFEKLFKQFTMPSYCRYI